MTMLNATVHLVTIADTFNSLYSRFIWGL